MPVLEPTLPILVPARCVQSLCSRVSLLSQFVSHTVWSASSPSCPTHLSTSTSLLCPLWTLQSESIGFSPETHLCFCGSPVKHASWKPSLTSCGWEPSLLAHGMRACTSVGQSVCCAHAVLQMLGDDHGRWKYEAFSAQSLVQFPPREHGGPYPPSEQTDPTSEPSSSLPAGVVGASSSQISRSVYQT